MSTREKFNLFPSRTNLVQMKLRMLSAQKGFNLLKRKRDVMELKKRELEESLKTKRSLSDEAVLSALFSLSRLRFMEVDIRPYGILKPNKADVVVKVNYQKTIGLLLPAFEILQRPSDCFSLAGMGRGGTEVRNVRLAFQEALRYIADVASIEYSIKVLNGGIHENSTRLNGLEYVLIPRYLNTIQYISTELDEFEREEFFRLKRTQARKAAQTKKDIEVMRAKRDDLDKYNSIIQKKEKERRRSKIGRDFVLSDSERRSTLQAMPSYAGTLTRLLQSLKYTKEESDDDEIKDTPSSVESNENEIGDVDGTVDGNVDGNVDSNVDGNEKTEKSARFNDETSENILELDSDVDIDDWDDYHADDTENSEEESNNQ